MFNLFDQLDVALVNPLIEISGQSQDSVRIIMIFLIQYPLGWFMHYAVHGTYVRHFFNIIVGLFL